MDEVFKALADPSRRRLLDLLNKRNGQCLRELCADLRMTRQSVSKHLAVLEAVNLATTLWSGRLSYTWHTFTPEWAEASGIAEETRTVIAAEGRSKVTFEIELVGDTVKLTVIHDGFETGSTVRTMVSGGWPMVLSQLKTLLPTFRVIQRSGGPNMGCELG
jgi:DNA-binding transcriptional ArsR family regulator